MSDMVPQDSLHSAFTEGRIEDLIDEKLWGKIQHADLNILNLECPLTNHIEAENKWGSCLKAVPECVNILKRIPNLVVNLANNHIKDYGEKGVLDTICTLTENKIPYVGAGKNIETIVRSVIIHKKQFKIGIYSCTEHEYSIAGKEAGANPVSAEDDIFELQRLSRECDYVIVLYHGGVEFYPYPTPEMRKRLNAYVRAGARLVVCQHSHCIGCVEQVSDGTVVYGQGNFLFGEREEVKNNIANTDMWVKGMLVEVQLPTQRIEYYFYSKEDGKLVSDVSQKEYEEMKARSECISIPGYLEERWEEYCSAHMDYMQIFRAEFGDKRYGLKSILKLIKGIVLRRKIYSDKEYLRIYDYLMCESHLELMRRNCRTELKRK